MTLDKVKDVLLVYKGLLVEWRPIREEHPELMRNMYSTPRHHAHWMVNEAIGFCEAGRTEKAMRWLGFIQGVLWCEGLRSIEDMKRDNMPPGEIEG